MLMPMRELLLTKYNFAPQRLWPCVTLEDLFRQLNSVKARLLGPGCERIHLPAAVRNNPGLTVEEVRRAGRVMRQSIIVHNLK